MIMYLSQIQIQRIINSDLQEYVESGRKIMNTETMGQSFLVWGEHMSVLPG